MRPMVGCALLLAGLSSAACTTRRSVTLDQLEAIEPERIWVTGNDQSVVLMYEPKIVRDTLVGYVGRYKERLPRTGVNEVRVQKAAPVRTALLVGGLTVGFAGFVLLVAGTGPSAVIVSSTGPPGLCDIDPEQTICTGVPE